MARRFLTDRKALSPVVGSSLLIVIVVLLATVAAVVFFSSAETNPAAPQADLVLEPVEGSDEYRLRLQAGDTIDGDRVRIRGVEDPDTLAGSELVAGKPVRVKPVDETVRIVWLENAAEGSSYILQTFDVDPASGGGGGGGATFPDGVVFTGSGGDIVQIAGDGGEVTTVLSGGTVEALGSAGVDVTGDGSPDLPFVTGSGELKIIDPDGDVTKVAEDADVPGDTIAIDQTKLAVGSWDGSDTSVFFANSNDEDTIYRATPSGSPVAVATPGNGVDGVTGFGDVDDDGDDELVFADGSQQIRYLESGGSTTSLTQAGSGSDSSESLGAGAVGTLDGYTGDVVSVVDGGNNIHVTNDAVDEEITGGDTDSGIKPQAKKSSVAIADVDDDGDDELVYVRDDDSTPANDGKVMYLDNFDGTLERKFLTDENGDKIDGSTETGTT